MPEFLYFDASLGEDDDHLQSVYRMEDGSIQFVAKKDAAQFEKNNQGKKKFKDRLDDLEQRVAALEAALKKAGL